MTTYYSVAVAIVATIALIDLTKREIYIEFKDLKVHIKAKNSTKDLTVYTDSQDPS